MPNKEPAWLPYYFMGPDHLLDSAQSLVFLQRRLLDPDAICFIGEKEEYRLGVVRIKVG
jgi:hypothetical protein